MRSFSKLILFFLFLAVSPNAAAQEVSVSAVLDSSKIRIGEQVKLDLYVTYNANQKNIKIQWPSIGDTLTGSIEVISVSPIDTTFPDKSNSAKIFQHQQITVSAYDSGYFAIPAFKFVVNGDTAHPIYTENFLLEVHTVPTDSSLAKTRDIKAPFGEKFNWRWYTSYIYAGIGLLLLIIAVIIITRYYTRKNMQVEAEPEKPRVPAHITALALLGKIKTEQAWKEGQVKEYYSSISDAVRLYIEERFFVKALESTTDEIMLAFRSQVVDPVSKEKLQQLLSLSDLVKFAKQFPIEAEHEFTLQNAFDFVNGTKREEEITLSDEDIAGATAAALQRTTAQAVVQRPAPVAGAGAGTVSARHSTTDEAAAGKPQKNTKQWVIRGAVALAAFFLVYFLMDRFVFSSGGQEEMMLSMAKGINQSCPIQVDRETRLDSVSVLDEKTFGYSYTLVNMEASQVDPAVMEQGIKAAILEQVKANPQFQPLRENSITLQYLYRDKHGNTLLVVKIEPEDYKTES